MSKFTKILIVIFFGLMAFPFLPNYMTLFVVPLLLCAGITYGLFCVFRKIWLKLFKLGSQGPQSFRFGVCKFCGQKTHFLSTQHSKCYRLSEEGIEKIATLLNDSLLKNKTIPEDLILQISNIELQNKTPSWKIKDISIQIWEDTVKKFMEDSLLSMDEEHLLIAYKNELDLSQDDLNKNGAYERVVKAGILRSLLEGNIPNRLEIEGNLSVNLQKDEQPIWVFGNVKYYREYKTRHYQGGSSGVSVRIAKGLYYRVGSYKGYPIESRELVQEDVGCMVVTNKHLYFSGEKESLRIPFGKIISFMPFDKGVGIMRDVANAKRQIFETGDGWFSYNLLTNAAKI